MCGCFRVCLSVRECVIVVCACFHLCTSVPVCMSVLCAASSPILHLSVSVFVLTLFLCVSLPPYFRLSVCARWYVCMDACLYLCVCAYVSVLCIFASVPH